MVARPTPAAPPAVSAPVSPATAEQIAALIPDQKVEVVLPPQPVPQFIDTLFGRVLRAPYVMGPNVAQRREIVALRGAPVTNGRTLFAMVQTALKDYGLIIAIENNVVRIVEDPAQSFASPKMSRATPDAPASARPVVQFMELAATDARSLLSLLNDSFPNRSNVRFSVREDLNAIVISGAARDVAAAALVIEQLDKPRFADGQVARIRPVYWSADRLAEAVTRVLTQEGYRVTADEDATQSAIVFTPVPFTNEVLLFSNRRDAFDRALFWVRELDQASRLGDETSTFIYQVRNTSAADLGELIAQAAPEATAAAARAPDAAQNGTLNRRAVVARQPMRSGSGANARLNDRVTIDPTGNRILFRGTPSEFEQIRTLMEQLDTPPRQVLVELTIAEVTLTDETRFGVEWFLQERLGTGLLTGNTRGGSNREPGGLGATFARAYSRGQVETALNAIATNRNLNILSTPRLLARSGSDAEILIGTDVPIITSQRAAGSQTSGDTDILQTVQYRQTGVILNMRPIIYGDDRVSIDLFQEVSSQEPNRTSAISSPVILNRSVSTQLALREGTTAVIGGLMQDNYSREQRGIPVLKDIPVVGSAFRSDAVSGGKVELLILITPYIVRDDAETDAIANDSLASFNETLRRRGAQVYTLLPWRNPIAVDTVHAK
jgi:general secretion pathway protein D